MTHSKINVGFCVAYDWYFLAHSLPLVYTSADLICISIDKDRISWAHNRYEFDEVLFFDLIKSVDKQNKILLYEEDFHLSHLSPMQNEVRQRNMMADKMGNDGWHIQLDCDEYFIDFEKFVSYLKKVAKRNIGNVNICCQWMTLFKRLEEGYLFISQQNKKSIEFIQVATNSPIYEYGRRNGHFNVYTNFKIVHQSWARSEQEIASKLNNWGHRNDFDSDRYIKMWTSLDLNNYHTFKNFHPVQPECWPGLNYVMAKSLEDMIQLFKTLKLPHLSLFDLMIRNSRIIAKIKRLLMI